MDPTTAGTYRVYPGRDDAEWLLLDVETADPTYLDRAAVPDGVALRPGYRVAATLAWVDGEPTVEALDVETETLFAFARTDEPVFETARECFEAARGAGEAMNSRVTRNTDADPNGVVYTFADQGHDLFGEFRDGGRPLDPLVTRLAESVDPPFEVFVLDPGEAFVVVYLVFEKRGRLADTVRDTYDLPRDA